MHREGAAAAIRTDQAAAAEASPSLDGDPPDRSGRRRCGARAKRREQRPERTSDSSPSLLGPSAGEARGSLVGLRTADAVGDALTADLRLGRSREHRTPPCDRADTER
jgi:hypothetical protein